MAGDLVGRRFSGETIGMLRAVTRAVRSFNGTPGGVSPCYCQALYGTLALERIDPRGPITRR